MFFSNLLSWTAARAGCVGPGTETPRSITEAARAGRAAENIPSAVTKIVDHSEQTVPVMDKRELVLKNATIYCFQYFF